MPTNDRDGD